MLVDFQLSFGKLQELIKQRIRATWKGYPDPIMWQGKESYVAGIRVESVTLQLAPQTTPIILNTLDGDEVVTPPSGGFSVSTRPIEAVLVGRVMVCAVDDMKTSNLQPPPVTNIPILAAVLTLTIGIEDGDIMFRATLKSLPGGENLDEDVKKKFTVKNKINLRAALGSNAANALPPIVNVGMAASDNLNFVTIRMDTSVPTESIRAQWENFYEGHVDDLRGGNDWALALPQKIIVDPLVESLKDQVDDSADFSITVQPSGVWAPIATIPRIQVTLSGEAIDACAGIDMDVNVTLDVILTVPQSNLLRAKIVISLDYNELEETGCVLAMAFAWPIVGPITLSDQDVDYKGWISLAGIFIDWPWRMIAAIVFIEGDFALDWLDTGKLVDDPNDDHIKYLDMPFSSNANLFGGKLNLLSIAATSRGPVMRGSMAIEDPIDMELKVGWVPFDGWYGKNACRDPFDFIGYMRLFFGGAPWGAPPRLPIRVARLSMMSADPSNQYDQRSWNGPPASTWVNAGEFECTLHNLKSSFKANPYALELLLVTNNGVRWVTFPIPPMPPEAPKDDNPLTGWKAKYLAWKMSHCWKHVNDWDRIHALWVLWKVDPGPEREFIRHWLVDVTGLQATDALTLFDEGTGVEIARMKAGADGHATVTALVAPTAKNPQAGVVVGLNGKFIKRADWDKARAKLAAPKTEPATKLAVRQQVFKKEGTLRLLMPANSVRLDNENGVPVLYISDRAGISTIALEPGESPTLLRRTPQAMTPGLIPNVAAIGSRMATIQDGQLVTFDVSDASAPKKLAAVKAAGVERIGRAPVRGLRHALWMEKGSAYEIVDMHDAAKPVTLGTSLIKPWYVDATRMSSLYAKLADDRRSVILYRMGEPAEGLEPPVKIIDIMKG